MSEMKLIVGACFLGVEQRALIYLRGSSVVENMLFLLKLGTTFCGRGSPFSVRHSLELRNDLFRQAVGCHFELPQVIQY
jgi:hypothetical protein